MSKIKETIGDEMSIDAENLLRAQQEEEYFKERRQQEKRLEVYQETIRATADILKAVDEGWVSASDAFAFFVVIERNVSKAKATIQERAMDILPPEGVEMYQLKFEKRNSAGRWSFGDPEYRAAKGRLKEMEELRKQSHKLAKMGSTILDPETGEIVPPAQFKEGKETIYVSKAREL